MGKSLIVIPLIVYLEYVESLLASKREMDYTVTHIFIYLFMLYVYFVGDVILCSFECLPFFFIAGITKRYPIGLEKPYV